MLDSKAAKQPAGWLKDLHTYLYSTGDEMPCPAYIAAGWLTCRNRAMNEQIIDSPTLEGAMLIRTKREQQQGVRLPTDRDELGPAPSYID